MDTNKDVLTFETQSLSGQEILLLTTQPLKEAKADTDAADRENDSTEVDVVMKPQNSEIFNTFKVLQAACLYHDVG